MFWYATVVILIVLSLSLTMAVPVAHIVAFVSPGGFASTISDIITPTQFWQQQLKKRNYPMNITIEYVNVNPINTFDLITAVQIAQPIIKARLLNMSLPKATVILGPDFAVGKKAGGQIASYLPYKGDLNGTFMPSHCIRNIHWSHVSISIPFLFSHLFVSLFARLFVCLWCHMLNSSPCPSEFLP